MIGLQKYKKLRLKWLMLIVVFGIIQSPLCVVANTGNGDLIVHITNSGSCYHMSGCGSLWRSDIPVELEYAYVHGYQRCEKCNPPAYTGSATRGQVLEKKNSGTNYHPESTKTYPPADTKKVTQDDRTTETTNNNALLIVGGALASCFLFFKIKNTVKEDKQKRRIEEEKKQILEKINGKFLREIAGVPSDIKLKNGKPRDNNDSAYGSYTVYLSINGTKYHKNQGCSSARYPKHIFDIKGSYSPCTKCCPPIARIPEWYNEYQQLIKECIDCGAYITYYCKNDKEVFIRQYTETDESIYVFYNGNEYIRPRSWIGTEFFKEKSIK